MSEQRQPRGTWGPSIEEFFASNKLVRVLLGGRGCLSAETPIYDPTTGESVAIGERAMRPESFHVLSLTPQGVQIAQAQQPFCKGFAALWRVTLENGRMFRCASEHKLLTPSGWQPISRLARGHVVASADNLPQTISGTSLEAWPQDDLDSMRTVPNFQVGYRRSFHSCDEPPPVSSKAVQVFSPSRFDAPIDSLGLKYESLRSRLWQSSGHTSKLRSVPSFEPCSAVDDLAACPGVVESPTTLISGESFQRSRRNAEHSRGCFLESDTWRLRHRDQAELELASSDRIRWVRIINIEIEETASAYYDFTVPVHANYLAEGIFHHNSSKTSALIDDICRHLWLNAGGKAILARQVDLSNLDSTIPTMLQWFKEIGGPIYSPQGSGGLFKVWDGGRKVRVPSRLAVEEMGKVSAKLRTKGEVARWIEEVGANLCGIIENRGLATEMAGGKLRGMECSYFAMVEADQIEERYFELCFACLRWKGADPATCDEGGFIRDKSVVLDTNPPGTRHWIALMEKEEAAKPERERRMAFWHISTYENEHNLPPNYINDQILLPYGDNPAMIERMLWGRYSDAFSSAPVYYSFRRERHEAYGLKWPRGALCIVGMDVGTQNASTISAMKIHAGHLYFWTMREIILEESDTDRQCLALLKVLANQFPFWNSEGEICPHTYFFCDPAARNSSFTKAGANSSALKVMQSHGIFPGMKIAAHLQPTIAACNRLMQENHPVDDGELVWHFKIDSDGCPDLFRGFQGLYRYAKVGESGYGSDLPVKGAACEGVDHVCFVAGTPILTARGELPIEQVCIGDFAMTRNGLRRVTAAFNRRADVRGYQFSNNRESVSTEDHPYWCAEKEMMIPVESLTHGDTLSSCTSTQKSLSSMGKSIDGILIHLTALLGFISNIIERILPTRYGKSTMDQGRRDFTSIIGMATRQITASKILNWLLPSATLNYISAMNAGESPPCWSIKLDISQRSGTRLRMDTDGIQNMPEKLDSEECTNLKGNAINAVNLIDSQRQTVAKNQPGFVQIIASRHGVARLVWTTWIVIANFAARFFASTNTQKQEGVHVVAESELVRNSLVFNITVEGEHEYYANGILVGNCDAWRYGLINAIEIARVGHPAGMTSAQKEANVDIEPRRSV